MAMKARRTIWFGHGPETVTNKATGKVEEKISPIFDKRVKKLSIGDDVPEALLKNKVYTDRMNEHNAIVDRLTPADQIKAAQQRESDEEEKAAKEKAKAAAAAKS